MLVLHAIYGPERDDPKADRTVLDVPLNWNAQTPLRSIRVGYVADAFREETEPLPARGGRGAGGFFGGGRAMTPEQRKQFAARRAEQAKFDQAVLDVLRGMGVTLHPVTLPPAPPFASYGPAVNCEAAAAFSGLIASGRARLMEPPVKNSSDWPSIFRVAHLYPAVDYLNADRIRLELMYQMEAMFRPYDVVVVPTSGPQLAITNLTGHPACIVPNGCVPNSRAARSSAERLQSRIAAMMQSFHMMPPSRNPVAMKNVACMPISCRMGSATAALSA